MLQEIYLPFIQVFIYIYIYIYIYVSNYVSRDLVVDFFKLFELFLVSVFFIFCQSSCFSI